MKLSLANGSLAAWLTRVVGALRNRNRVQVTDAALSMHDVPQITSGWDYRPKDVIRRDTAFDVGRAGAAELVNSSASTPKENDDVWFSFTSPEPTEEHAPRIARSSTDGGSIST
jgi:hypothetical protein